MLLKNRYAFRCGRSFSQNLPVQTKMEGVSLSSILQKPSSSKERNVFIPHADRKSYAVVNSNWRYIYYNDGNEELYDVKNDPNEWTNLIGDRKYDEILTEMKKSAPAVFAPAATPKNDLKLIVEGDSFHWEKKN